MTQNLLNTSSNPETGKARLYALEAALQLDEAAMLVGNPGSQAPIGTFGDQTLTGGRLFFAQLAPPAAPTLSTNGTPGSTTYDYSIEAVIGKGNSGAGAATAITTGASTLTSVNSINIVFTSVPGATSYNVRRTTGGSTQGVIGTVAATGAATYTFVDTGLVGDASTSPTLNTTGVAQGIIAELPTDYPANGAITNFGIGWLTKAGVDVMTIAAPIAGAVSAGGHDGLTINIIDQGGHAHTVTGPSNCFNGASHVATFGGAVANNFTIKARNGVWYVTGNSGVTLS